MWQIANEAGGNSIEAIVVSFSKVLNFGKAGHILKPGFQLEYGVLIISQD
jgi:hypothetical protein